MNETRILRSPWWVVFGSTLGLIVSNGPVTLFTLGVFLKPISQDFGWNRGTVAAAEVVLQTCCAAVTPYVGKLIDRWGIRRVMIPIVILFSLTTAAISQTPHSKFVFFLLFAIWGIAASGQGPLPYAKAISAWFDSRRGLALGLAISGVGLGATLLPAAAEWIILHFGWRDAYIGLGIITFVCAFPAVTFFVREPDSSIADNPSSPLKGSTPSESLQGMSGREVLRDYRFWFMSVAAFCVATAINGAMAHTVAILTDRGVPVLLATSVLTASGVAMVVGRISSGYLLDEFFAPYVAAIFFLCPLAGIIFLSTGLGGIVPFLGTIGLGLGLGGEVALLAFLVGKYFGLRSFAQIYGYLFGAVLLGSGLGPWLAGVCFDVTRSYNIALIGFDVALLLSSILISRLGPYSYPDGSLIAEEEPASPVAAP